jgi:hypothetical protein
VGAGNNLLNGVAAVSTGDVWAVGMDGSYPAKTLIEHWNGSAWSAVTSPNSGTGHNQLNGVTAVATGDVWAAGQDGAAHPGGLAEHWDGSAWTVATVAGSGASNNFNGITAVGSADVWGVGSNGTAPTGTLTDHYTGPGALGVPDPSAIAFPAVTLSGVQQTVSGNQVILPSDTTGGVTGWKVSATAAQFAAGGHTLPATALQVGSASGVAGTGNCVVPASSGTVSYPVPLAAAPSVIYQVSANTGTGGNSVTVGLDLAVPGGAYTGSYSSTVTYTIAVGP